MMISLPFDCCTWLVHFSWARYYRSSRSSRRECYWESLWCILITPRPEPAEKSTLKGGGGSAEWRKPTEPFWLLGLGSEVKEEELLGQGSLEIMKMTLLPLQSGFFLKCLFRFKTSSVYCMSRESDISQETIDDLASKVIFRARKNI